MNITANKADNKLTIVLEGHIDSSNATVAEEKINEALKNTNSYYVGDIRSSISEGGGLQ